MNKKYWLFTIMLLIVIFFFNFNKGKKTNDSFNFLSQKDSIQLYYFHINKAELSICDSNYTQALDNYLNAFSYINSPFPNDIYNSLILNIYLRNYSDAIKLCEKLVLLGVNMTFFNQVPLKSLKNDTVLWNSFISKYDSLNEVYKSKIDFELRNEIYKLFLNDQKNFCNIDIETGIIPYIQTQDTVFEKYFDILKKYGYPNHDLLGIDLINDTIIKPSFQATIIQHMYQESIDSIEKVSALLKKEIFRGRLLPADFMNWDEFRYEPNHHYGKSILLKSMYEKDIYFYKLNLDSLRIKKYNYNRSEIFMYSFEDNLKKLIFIQKNPDNKFNFIIYGLYEMDNFEDNLKKLAFKKINFNDY